MKKRTRRTPPPGLAMYMTFAWHDVLNDEQLRVIPAISKFCNTLIVVVPSRFEVSNLDDHAGGEAIKRALAWGMKAILMRKLTPTFRTKMTRYWRRYWSQYTDPKVFRDHGFLAAALASVRAEAELLYASSGLYCETHNPPMKKWKRRPMPASERRAITLAGRRAVEIAGRAEYMLPHGSRDRRRSSWPFSELAPHWLGGRILGNGMYKRKDGKFDDKSNPPLGYSRDVNPGLWVAGTNTPQKTMWSPKAVLEWMNGPGWVQWRKGHPGTEWPWVYWSQGRKPGTITRIVELFAEAE